MSEQDEAGGLPRDAGYVARGRAILGHPLSIRLMQSIALAALVLIGVLSLVGGADRPHTGVPGYVEHVAAYLLTGCALGIAFPRRRAEALVTLLALACSLELFQVLVDGRHGRPADALAGALGGIIGLWLSVFASVSFAGPVSRL